MFYLLFDFRPAKSARLLMFLIFAALMLSCNDNMEVEITPAKEKPEEEKPEEKKPQVTYNTSRCTNMGDIMGNGTAFFIMELYNLTNPNTDLYIMGFANPPEGSDDFRLETGTYPISGFGAEKTLMPGMYDRENGVNVGTYLFYTLTGGVTHILDGEMTISQSDNTTTIQCDFYGEELSTGASVEDMRFGFSGTISYYDPLPAKCSYTASGIPRWASPSGYSTWTGTVEPSINLKRFTISNWGRVGITVYCEEVDGKLIIDNHTKVLTYNSYDCYLRVAFIDSEAKELIIIQSDYVIHFTPFTVLLDFSGIIQYNGKNYPALIGVVGYNQADEIRLFDDFYENLKFQLTPIRTTSEMAIAPTSSQITGITQPIVCTYPSYEPINDRNPTHIVIDKNDESKLKRIPLKDVKHIPFDDVLRIP